MSESADSARLSAGELERAIASLRDARRHMTQAAKLYMRKREPAYPLAVKAAQSARAALELADRSLAAATTAEAEAAKVSAWSKRQEPPLSEDAIREIARAEQEATSIAALAVSLQRDAESRFERVSETATLLSALVAAGGKTSEQAERLELLAEEIRDVLSRAQDEAEGALPATGEAADDDAAGNGS